MGRLSVTDEKHARHCMTFHSVSGRVNRTNERTPAVVDRGRLHLSCNVYYAFRSMQPLNWEFVLSLSGTGKFTSFKY